jgi:CheY-like chemotaxis protein
MKILLVEDNPTFAGELEHEARSIPQCELVWVSNRNDALARIDSHEAFDLVILDRKLPSAHGVLDDHVEHGWRVFQAVRTLSAGTPVWFLTGTEDADFAADLANEYARAEDLHGRRVNEPMYQVFWKKRIAECVRRLKEFAANQATLERIAVELVPTTLVLEHGDLRTVRIFTARHAGAVAEVTSLNGGLSNSRVLKVIVKAADRLPLITAAGKVSSLAETQDEEQRYRTNISRLIPGGFPQLTEIIDAGAAKTGGLFYGMVGPNVESLFDRLIAAAENVALVPVELRAIMQPWYQAKRSDHLQVSQIRRKLIGDTVLPQIGAHLDGIDTAAIENYALSAALCCQHGDLHCANVVFDGRGQAMLIDFGDTGLSFAAVDPVTLELSTIFHSQHARLPAGWPDEDDMLAWPDRSRFTLNCPYSPFISACREWANSEAASQDEVIAVAYAYAMRQLKYQDTDKRLATALIRACADYFRAPTMRAAG